MARVSLTSLTSLGRAEASTLDNRQRTTAWLPYLISSDVHACCSCLLQGRGSFRKSLTLTVLEMECRKDTGYRGYREIVAFMQRHT